MDDEPLLWEPYDRHWIRLRGPWDVSWINPPPGGDDPPPGVASGRVILPANWRDLFGDRPGTARFCRRFQRPSNLDPEERVLITLCEVRCRVRAVLNDTVLSPIDEPIGDPASAPCEESLSFDMTDAMSQANRLVLDLTVEGTETDEGPCGLWRPVLLEIITPD